MPGYNTHLSWSATLGVSLGLVARVGYHAPLSEALFGGFLCALGGILPDIDSDKSMAHKRCMTAISGSVALLMACRLRDFMLRPETVLLISATVYFALFYGAGTVVQKFSVHRGMFHSIPFGIICAELIFILSSGSTQLRLFKAACIFLGVMIHLTLDELSSARLISETPSSASSHNSYPNSYSNSNSPSLHGGVGNRSQTPSRRFGVKKSFGTAFKLIDYKHFGSTIVFYCVAVVLGHMAMNVQSVLLKLGDANVSELRGKAAVDRIKDMYPAQFDLSVVQWVAENDMVLTPGTDDNVKWHELNDLLSISDEPKEKEEVASNTEESLSLLDVVNWNSMNTPSPENLESMN